MHPKSQLKDVKKIVVWNFWHFWMTGIFFGLFFGIIPASPVDKLLSAVYLISSEWDMLQCVQFPTVVGFVDIQSSLWENHERTK